MTHEEFSKIIPGKTLVDVVTTEGTKRMLVKFFLCDIGENFDGYWMCCTEDLTNPYPTERREDDWNVYANNAEIINFMDTDCHTILSEDYVSIETAKLLKEKGFNIPVRYEYHNVINMNQKPQFHKRLHNFNGEEYSRLHTKWYSAPTLQMTMKWLREVHGLFVSIGNDDLDYNWQIFDVKNRTKDLDPTCLTDSYAGYRKYELAAEAAIKYCLENLI